LSLLTLLLLVFCVGADHPDYALAAHNLAVLTNTSDAGSNFHGFYNPAKMVESKSISEH